MLCITDKWDKMGIKIEDKMWGLVLYTPLSILNLYNHLLLNYLISMQLHNNHSSITLVMNVMSLQRV